MLVLSMVPSVNVSALKEKKKQKVTPGVEVLLGDQKELLKGKRVGLITNPTGVDSKLTSIVDLLHEDPDIELTALYGPEHGVRGDAQAGEYVDFYVDEKTGLPVYSLYGQTRKPTPEMLENVDVLVFDIQDVGTRYYTYIYTMAYAMEAAKENDIPFIVLDRPNPQGGLTVDGPVLEPEFSSFVGLYPIPLIHGMTVGELAMLFNEEFDIGANLKVVKMKGWKRSMDYDETGLPFVLPSPNMPTVSTTIVYPATGLIEGTNVSEGRGTTKPFELIGAPYINSTELAETLNSLGLPGVTFRAASFTPAFSKHAGKLSHGVEIYVTNRDTFKAVPTGLHIIKTIHDLYPDDFEFLAVNNFGRLIGNDWVRTMIEEGASVSDIVTEYQDDLMRFKKIREQYLMYK
ncbi:exo-beta-N-acetylmuramidase NamZ family protein [Metabacillus sp. Hm71]|uniref:exo-beta-N-acetylmuramidase NamZ family protein n=1 Tax=Metabacillus sp. Hm71 TaxID=3450743 RepID=UPI003F42EB63